MARLLAVTMFAAAALALFGVAVMFLAVDAVDWPILGAAFLVLPIAAVMWRRGLRRRERERTPPRRG